MVDVHTYVHLSPNCGYNIYLSASLSTSINQFIIAAGQHEVIAENLSLAVVSDLNSLVKSLKDDRRKVSYVLRFLLHLVIRFFLRNIKKISLL